ncbi:hypothetical protein E0485_05580 [Paenibacillus albiflavus]|uniref:Phosphoribulokinase/uridine kinase domain-containing protein n=1 Tax=Paenibacillus albiflavus TaxID=2545760 RepID=A0A4R4ELK5_9BACL|nr:hypothetical protein E0485_05580 [Paenibacillus albiflavus]
MNTRPRIIAIAAVSGGGKTTITSRLNLELDKSRAIYFDDYDLEGPEDIIDWVDRGADCNEWNIDPIIIDVKNLIDTNDLNYILLDYPFSRLHDNLKAIDLTVFIDTPLDIAMARRLLRDFRDANTEVIINEISNYISRGRMGYERMLNKIKPNSDLVIEGSLPVNEIIRVIIDEINN